LARIAHTLIIRREAYFENAFSGEDRMGAVSNWEYYAYAIPLTVIPAAVFFMVQGQLLFWVDGARNRERGSRYLGNAALLFAILGYFILPAMGFNTDPRYMLSVGLFCAIFAAIGGDTLLVRAFVAFVALFTFGNLDTHDLRLGWYQVYLFSAIVILVALERLSAFAASRQKGRTPTPDTPQQAAGPSPSPASKFQQPNVESGTIYYSRLPKDIGVKTEEAHIEHLKQAPGTTNLSPRSKSGLASGFGIAALVLAILAIAIPFGIVLSGVAILLSVIGALAGDRLFATATAVIAVVNALVLSPSTWILMGGNDQSARSFITAVIVVGGLLPFGAMLLNATGNVVLGRR
jgi:hypothetical protein